MNKKKLEKTNANLFADGLGWAWLTLAIPGLFGW